MNLLLNANIQHIDEPDLSIIKEDKNTNEAKSLQNKFAEKFNLLNKEKQSKLDTVQKSLNDQTQLKLEKMKRKEELELQLQQLNKEIIQINKTIEMQQKERQEIENDYAKKTDNLNLESKGIVNMIRISEATNQLKNNYKDLYTVLKSSIQIIQLNDSEINDKKINLLTQTVRYMTKEVKCVNFIKNRLNENIERCKSLENNNNNNKTIEECKNYINSDKETLNTLLSKVNESVEIVNSQIIHTPLVETQGPYLQKLLSLYHSIGEDVSFEGVPTPSFTALTPDGITTTVPDVKTTPAKNIVNNKQSSVKKVVKTPTKPTNSPMPKLTWASSPAPANPAPSLDDILKEQEKTGKK